MAAFLVGLVQLLHHVRGHDRSANLVRTMVRKQS